MALAQSDFWPAHKIEVTLYSDERCEQFFKFMRDGSNWVSLPEENPEPPETVQNKEQWKSINHKPALEGEIARVYKEERGSSGFTELVVGVRHYLPYKYGGGRDIPAEKVLPLLQILGILPSK